MFLGTHVVITGGSTTDMGGVSPKDGTIVRIGHIKPPFGAGLVVTAYPSKDELTIVVHGTIINDKITIELPELLVLNKTIEPELVPVDEAQVALPNGPVANITIYRVNQTVRMGKATVVAYGNV